MPARGNAVRTLGMVVVAALTALLLARAGAQAATTATTAAAPPVLALQVIGAGNVSGGGLLCGDGNMKCAASYSTQAIDVTLVANAAAGWHFVGWVDDGASCGSNPSCHVSGTGSQTVTARFGTNSAVDSSTLNVFLAGAGTGTVTNQVNGGGDSEYPIDCSNANSSSTCSITVVKGSTLTVRQQAGSGFFNGWGGSCSGTAPTCSIYLPNSESISATFVSGAATKLTISVDGAGNVVADSGATCTGGSTCTYDEPPTAEITLTAEPSKGYAFTGWTGDCLGTQTQCQVQMSEARDVTATFDQLVPVLITVAGNGVVTGDGISCGPGPVTCNAQAAPGSTLQLTGTPGATSTSAVSWAGCAASAGQICTVQVGDNPIEVEADFTAGTGGGGGGGGSTVSVSVQVHGDGYVTMFGNSTFFCTSAGGSGCTASVQQNTNVVLSATTVPGATFGGWSGITGCAATSSTCSFVVNGAKTVITTFTGGSSAIHTLKVGMAGGGSGTVSGPGIHCTSNGGAGCSSPEPGNLTLTLTVTAASGSTFTGWSGACTSTALLCNLSMTADQSVTANFSSTGGGGSSTEATLTLAVTGAGKVTTPGSACAAKVGKTSDCSTQYKKGTAVELKAVPVHGYAFAGWKGSCTGKKTTCSVTMDESRTVEASFTRLALVPSTKKPTVAKLKTGYRITLRFTAAEPGRLSAVARHSGSKPVAATKTVKTGAGLIRITVKKTGRYVVVLTLHARSGAHAIRYTVRI